MRDRTFAIVAAFLAALFVIAGGIWFYDHSRDDLIAKGITIGGIDVGGMRAASAKRKLREELLPRLRKPVVVRSGHHRYVLTPTRARVGTDIDTVVAQAVDRSRRGSIITRTWRALRGTAIHAAIQPEVRYSPVAVHRFVAHVGHRLDRKPRNASLSFSGDGISQVRGRYGVAVDSAALTHRVEAAITGRSLAHVVRVREHKIAPKTTTKDLARVYPRVITINRGAFKLSLFKNLKLTKTYSIAVGRVGLETPAGLYHILDKQVDPSWHVPNSSWAGSLAGQVIPPGPADPLKARWMGIFNGAGIHGTSDIGSLGSAASHGCIRMAIPDVEELYDQVSVGTPVYIA